MKKSYLLLILVLVLTMAALSGCGGNNSNQGGAAEDESDTPQASDIINVAAMAGPTGMGMSQLSTLDWYNVSILQSADEAVAKVISGEVDIAALPTNLGAVLYQKTEKNLQVLAVNTMGVLYIVENSGETINSPADLRGKTILANGQGGVPEYALKKILSDAGVNPDTDVTFQWMSSHTDVASALMTTEGAVALLPEPQVTVVGSKNDKIRVAIDLNQVWKDTVGQDLPMGIIVAQKSFIENRASDLELFMEDYQASVDFTNQMPTEAAQLIADAGIVADPAVAEAAIPKCRIVYVAGEDMKNTLDSFYQVLFGYNPSAVGGTLPDENFYFI